MSTAKLFRVTLTGTRQSDGEEVKETFLTERPNQIISSFLGFDGVTHWYRIDTEPYSEP